MPQWLSSQQAGSINQRQALMPIGGDEDADLLPDREPIGSAFFKAYTPSLPAATGKKRILKKYSVLIILGVIALFKVSLVVDCQHWFPSCGFAAEADTARFNCFPTRRFSRITTTLTRKRANWSH